MKVELEEEGGGEEEEEDNIHVARSPSFGDDKRISSLEEVSDGLGFQFSFPVLVPDVEEGVTVPEPCPGTPSRRAYLDESAPDLSLSGPGSSSSEDEEEAEAAAVGGGGSTTSSTGSAKDSFARSGSEPAVGSTSKWGKLRSLMVGRSHSERKNKYRSRNPNSNPNPKKKENNKEKKKEKEGVNKRSRDVGTANRLFYGKEGGAAPTTTTTTTGNRRSTFLPYRKELIGIFPPSLNRIIKRNSHS